MTFGLAVMIPLASAVGAEPRIVPAKLGQSDTTMWSPTLEWTLENPSHLPNPFDLVAKVTFTHESGKGKHITEMFYAGKNKWKFRFTGTRTGKWTFSTQADGRDGTTDDPELHGRGGTITVGPNRNRNANGFLTSDGQTWCWQGSERAFVPQLLMIGDNSTADPKWYSDPAYVDRLIRTFIGEHGFTGLHTNRIAGYWFDIDAGTQLTSAMTDPDPRTFEALETLITRTHAQGAMVHIWAWGDRGRRQTPWELDGGINGKVDRRLQRYIAARLGPIPGWSMGYGFDLDEWTNPRQIDAWNRFMQEHMGWHHFLGGRPKGPNGGVRHSQYNDWNDGLEYASYEHHKPDYEVCVGALAELKDRPAFSEDRNRVRGRRKDWTESETRRGLWQSTMAGGVANIWGQITTKHKDANTGLYANKNQLKTYSVFWFDKQRYLKRMIRANDLSDDRDKPRPNHVDNDTNTRVLKASRDRIVFYRQDASSIHMDLTGMSGPQPVVAVDTTRAYREIPLGTLEPGKHTWQAPRKSDWAIAVGRFATDRDRDRRP
jgi:hypothetical protein